MCFFGNLFAAAASKGYETWSLTIELTFCSVARATQTKLSRFGHQLLLVVLRAFFRLYSEAGWNGFDSRDGYRTDRELTLSGLLDCCKLPSSVGNSLLDIGYSNPGERSFARNTPLQFLAAPQPLVFVFESK